MVRRRWHTSHSPSRASARACTAGSGHAPAPPSPAHAAMRRSRFTLGQACASPVGQAWGGHCAFPYAAFHSEACPHRAVPWTGQGGSELAAGFQSLSPVPWSAGEGVTQCARGHGALEIGGRIACVLSIALPCPVCVGVPCSESKGADAAVSAPTAEELAPHPMGSTGDLCARRTCNWVLVSSYAEPSCSTGQVCACGLSGQLGEVGPGRRAANRVQRLRGRSTRPEAVCKKPHIQWT